MLMVDLATWDRGVNLIEGGDDRQSLAVRDPCSPSDLRYHIHMKSQDSQKQSRMRGTGKRVDDLIAIS